MLSPHQISHGANAFTVQMEEGVTRGWAARTMAPDDFMKAARDPECNSKLQQGDAGLAGHVNKFFVDNSSENKKHFGGEVLL